MISQATQFGRSPVDQYRPGPVTPPVQPELAQSSRRCRQHPGTAPRNALEHRPADPPGADQDVTAIFGPPQHHVRPFQRRQRLHQVGPVDTRAIAADQHHLLGTGEADAQGVVHALAQVGSALRDQAATPSARQRWNSADPISPPPPVPPAPAPPRSACPRSTAPAAVQVAGLLRREMRDHPGLHRAGHGRGQTG